METNKITYSQIERYLRGDLDEKAMHQLERQALSDPFLADAIEGFAHVDSSSDQHLSILQRQLHQRIAHQQEKKNEFHFTWQRISIAAAASLMFISASILFWMKGSQTEQQTLNSEKKVDVILASPDNSEARGNLKFKIIRDGQAVQNIQSPEPIIGWSGYEAYIQKNLPFSTDKLVIKFEVNTKGELQNLTVSEGLDPALKNEVLKVILGGPKWKPAPKLTRIQVEIN